MKGCKVYSDEMSLQNDLEISRLCHRISPAFLFSERQRLGHELSKVQETYSR